MKPVVTGMVAAVLEAWQELRIHKLRVLLSLVGVCIAVTAMSGAAALGDIGQQTVRESYERQGRPALLSTWIYKDDGYGPSGLRANEAREAFTKVADRFGISYWTINAYANTFEVSTEAGTTTASTQVVDEDFRDMRRMVIGRGRWVTERDAENRSPAVVIDHALAVRLGVDQGPLPTTVTVRSQGGISVAATVVGVTARRNDNGDPNGTLYLLYDTYANWFSDTDPIQDAGWEMWVPIPGAEELAEDVQRALSAELAGYEVDTSRSDYLAWGSDELDIAKWVVIAISSLILLLGAVSLLNVTVITMGQRVREIGIRRSFGATTGRVFFSVVMESVVATTVAGVVGVLLAIAIVSGPWTAKYLLAGIDDPPGFPFSAALLGIGAAVAVGMIAGVVPAVIAARVRIVNAIRF